MNKIQKDIESEYQKHMDCLHRMYGLMEKLPNHNKDCNCDEPLHVDFDIDWSDGTVSVGCMRCGGYVSL